jgi:GntR family transcriptional repressor for pyruvate dehydrogenase complex
LKVTRVRLSDQVANEIKNMILNNDFKAGDKLPVENELAKMFSVSRVTVREAISKLSLTGIIDVRQGEGTFVKKLGPDSFMKPLLPMLMMEKKDVQDVFEVRLLIECKNAELAAKNATPAELAKIKVCLDKMEKCAMEGDLEQYNRQDTRFHYLIAKCSHNQVLVTIQELLTDMINSSIKVTLQPPNALATSVLLHRKIYEALRNQDQKAAFEAMHQHISGGAGYVESNL